MNFIKRYRYTIILILIFILLVCLGVKIKDILIPDDQKASYGNRLEALSEHEIEESLYTKIKTELGKKDNVNKITHRRQGKVINFIVNVSNETDLKTAKSIGEEIVKYFSEEDVKYYTFQIYMNKDDEKLNDFPIIGAKNPLSEDIDWTQDRKIVEGDSVNEK